MLDKTAVDAFWNSRATIQDPRIAANFGNDSRIVYDQALVSRYTSCGCSILDLGAGSCTLTRPFLDSGCHILAVEKASGLLNKSPERPNLVKVCSDILEFETDQKFDIVLLFGVVNYIQSFEEEALYRKVKTLLHPDGVFLVKNQCGVQDEVKVDHVSEKLGQRYVARYPCQFAQEAALAHYFNVSKHDIYPPELNRWDNTHFLAFICKNRSCYDSSS